MKNHILLHHNESIDPTFNLALEELLTTDSQAEHFMLWRNAPSVIIGKNQNTAAEINADAVREREIRVVRRVTGGGAVYHDLGNINFSYVSASSAWTEESPAHFTAPIVSVLRQLGVDAAFAGRNDITANGSKVSGCARSVLKNRTLFHGTLLFHTDLGVLAQVLNPDPEKIRSKGIKSVRARVENIRNLLSVPMEMDEFISILKEGLLRFFGIREYSPFPAELAVKAEALANARYRTWDWNYGTGLCFEYTHSIRFAGGRIRAEMNIRENRICDLHFSGDFFGSHPVDFLARQFNGRTPRRQELESFSESLPLSDYISGITAAELAALLAISE